MKKIIYIGLLKLKLLSRDKVSFIAMFLAPIAFIAIVCIGFGSGSTDSSDIKYPVAVVNNDNGEYSKKLISMMKDGKYFKVKEQSLSKSKEGVENNEITMGFVIDSSFSKAIENGEAGNIEILKLQDNENTAAFSVIVQNYINQLKIGKKAGVAAANTLASMKLINENESYEVGNNVETEYLKNIKSPVNTYTMETIQKDKEHAKDSLSTNCMGIIIMFIMFFVTMGAGSMLEEREIGTWDRIEATPTRNHSVLSGYILGNFLIGWIQTGVLIVFSKYVFNLSWGTSIPGIIMLFSSFLLCATALGCALASIVKSKAQLSTLAPIVVIPTCLLAGCMWPREIMSKTMLKISDFVPQTWAIKGMTDLITKGLDFNAVIIPSLVLLAFSAVFFIIGVTFMNLQKE